MSRTTTLLSPRRSAGLAARLLRWFAANARNLPWRHTRDPYAIWISEIMLQQTQVRTVIPYWERWMRVLPDMRALARAPQARVLKLWEGLGYYTRGRNLQKAARQILRRHSGRFPDRFEDILALPGVGRYTAGAIASIAFNQPAPILDGNVTRVLTRLFGVRGDPRARETNDRLWTLAGELVRAARPLRVRTGFFLAGACSALNQALMELGATLCSPRAPRCPECPVRRLCAARRRGWTESLPAKRRQSALIDRRFVAFIVEHEEQVLVRQRPAGVVNAHLWEFPNMETVAAGIRPEVAFKELFRRRSPGLEPLGLVRHTITRHRIALEGFRARAGRTLARRLGTAGSGFQWAPLGDLGALALPSAHRKLERLWVHARTGPGRVGKEK